LEKWLLFSVASLILWGVWGVLLKYVSEGLPWRSLYFFSGLATVAIVTVIGLVWRGDLFSASPRQALLAFLAGLFGATGYIAMIKALETGGSASVVVPLTSLYPAVTVVLARILLGEEITLSKALGVVLALLAIYLFSKP